MIAYYIGTPYTWLHPATKTNRITFTLRKEGQCMIDLPCTLTPLEAEMIKNHITLIMELNHDN